MYSQASKASSWMYSQAPKASCWGTCETAKQHPKPRPGAPAKQPKSRQNLQKSNPQAPSIRTGLLWRAPPYSEGSADIDIIAFGLPGVKYSQQTSFSYEPVSHFLCHEAT